MVPGEALEKCGASQRSSEILFLTPAERRWQNFVRAFVRSAMARTGVITFGEIAESFPMLNVECSRCGRHGRYNTVKLVERFGADETVQPFQEWITKDCPEKHDPRYAFGKCAPMMPDLRLLPRKQPR